MDYKSLLDKLEKEGLEVAEDAAEKVVHAVLDWAVDEVVKSENKYDDLLLAILPAAKEALLKAIDKIDKEEG